MTEWNKVGNTITFNERNVKTQHIHTSAIRALYLPSGDCHLNKQSDVRSIEILFTLRHWDDYQFLISLHVQIEPKMSCLFDIVTDYFHISLFIVSSSSFQFLSLFAQQRTMAVLYIQNVYEGIHKQQSRLTLLSLIQAYLKICDATDLQFI